MSNEITKIKYDDNKQKKRNILSHTHTHTEQCEFHTSSQAWTIRAQEFPRVSP